ELQLGGEAVGREVRDEPPGGVLEHGGALLPGPGHATGGERLLQGEAVALPDHHHGDGDRRIALDGRVHDAGGVVVEDHGVVAGLLAREGLEVEGAHAALDEQGPSRSGGRRDDGGLAALRRLGARGAGGDQLELAGGGHGGGAAGRRAVGDLPAGRGRVGRAAVGVVHRGDGDGAGGDTGSAAGERAGHTLVAGGDHHGDPVV